MATQPITLFNARGIGDRVGYTSEWVRRLIRAGKIPVAALLNGRTPLVDESALREIKRQRERQKQRAA